MASFQNMVITTAGLELLQDLILEGGTPLTFSGVGVGDGLLEDSDITAKTSLVHEVHRLPIEKIEKQEGGHIRVFARLATDIITTDFYHRELGVFTRYGEQEILFAYGNAGDDYDFIPATGNNASICKTIVTEFTVGSMKAVFLPLDSKDFVTHEAMNAQVEEVITRETRKVLKAIPQVDAAGNMTLAGGLTAAGAINANGGVNIPLAVGAVTDTAAVNRFYTSGLAGAVSALVQPIYLNSSSITVAGSISKSSNGTLAGLTQRFSVGAASAGSNAYGSAVIPLIGPNGQFNYSSVCGFSLAVNATAFAKFTFGIGRGSKTNRTGLTMDSYSMIPGDNLAVNYGEIVDVTINTPYDTVRKGYEIRVREIFYVSSVGHWQVKTTTVFLPVGHNELMPQGLNRLIFMQSGPPSIEEREEKAALYMELGGGSTNTLFKIASLRGFIAFEAGTGVSTLIIDARNEKTYALSADAGTGTRHLYANGLTNPTYHALEAMAVNAIESEETADFEDINIPL